MTDWNDGWKHYRRLAAQQLLAESLIEPEERLEVQPGGGSAKEYAERYADQELMKGIALLEEGEDSPDVLSAISADNWEQPDPQRFLASLNSSKRQSFLSPYSPEEFASMRLFKLEGFDIGFAVKSDGDIVSVHNNAGIRGAGQALMQAAIRNGGTKLDHFDGFLTGFYEKNGFGKVVNVDAWNDEWAPSGWEYEKVNIWDPRNSVYAKELAKYDKMDDVPTELRAKIQQYESGKPDIVYRVRG